MTDDCSLMAGGRPQAPAANCGFKIQPGAAFALRFANREILKTAGWRGVDGLRSGFRREGSAAGWLTREGI